MFAPPARTFQRTVYRPGEVCQFDVWEPRAQIPVGHGQTRRGWVVIACLGYSRAGAGVLVFSKQTEDLLAGIAGCLSGWAALPQRLVWDRQAGIHGHGGRPTDAFAGVLRAAAGRLAVLRAGRSAGQGRGRAAAGLRGDQLRTRPRVRQRARLPAPARRLVCEGQRAHAQDAARAPDRPARAIEREHMAALPSELPDTARRWVTRVAPDPYLRLDTNDYSLDPRLGRPARRGPRRPARGHGGRAGHRRDRLPAHRACSRAIRRSPRSITPAPCATAAARRPNPRSRSGRWPATTR